MFFRRAGILIAAVLALGPAGAGEGRGETLFVREVPETILRKLVSTNETSGAFVQTKTLPSGETFECRGTYRIRPGRDFEWRVAEPFDALFASDLESCVYSNEDERVVRKLADLKGFSNFADFAKGDFSAFFKAFDAVYKEDEPSGSGDGERVFHVLAKPRDARLAKFLSRVEADGAVGKWVLKATFPDGTVFKVRFEDAAKKEVRE